MLERQTKGAGAFTVVSVTYMQDTLRMDSNQIGFVFLITLLSSVFGAKLGGYITNKTNPNTSLRLSILVFICSTAVAFFVLVNPEKQNYAYLFGVQWGMELGWLFTAENVYFAMCLPKGREAEFSGFYVYCSTVLGWSPLLLFMALNEAGVHQKWGLVLLIIYLAIAALLLTCVSSWAVVIEEASKVENDEENEENASNNNNVSVL